MSEMKNINNGGPAFPHHDSGDTSMRPGMSLRDWFAGKVAPQVMVSISSLSQDEVLQLCASKAAKSSKQLIAISAYELADAMIAARKEGR